jgi:hypothetical protein
LRITRRFVGNSPAPRISVINYHDFFHRTDYVIPLTSRFLELELEESVTRTWADMIPEIQNGRRPKKTLSQEQQTFVQEHADRAAEAWILDRIDGQWRETRCYVQRNVKATVTVSLNEMEAKTWRLQRRLDELEVNLARKHREARELASSRSSRLLNEINGIRTKGTAK